MNAVFCTDSVGTGTKIAIQKFLNLKGAGIKVNGKFGTETHLAFRKWLISEGLVTKVQPTGNWKEPDSITALQEFLGKWKERVKVKELMEDQTQTKKLQEEDLTIEQMIGRGASSVVYTGKYQNREVAIKVFSEASLAFDLRDFYRETTILNALDHPHILAFEGSCVSLRRDSQSVFLLVTELCSGGSLKKRLREKGALRLPEIIKYGKEISSAMAYVHSVDIIHRDLKAENILIDKFGNAKVGDLGLARGLDINMTCLAGTPKWEAPEVITGQRYSTPADVYSFGMLLYEMSTGG